MKRIGDMRVLLSMANGKALANSLMLMGPTMRDTSKMAKWKERGHSSMGPKDLPTRATGWLISSMAMAFSTIKIH